MGERDPRDTRQRILDAAEQLFAHHGIAATSLRTITGEAGVNLAAVNYHFGSREALVQAIYDRRLGPINQERLRRLGQCEAEAAPGAPELECIIRAFITPALRLRLNPERGGENFMCLMGRIYSEPMEQKMVLLRQFEEVSRRYAAAFGRALPHLPETERLWRFHFLIGAMAHTAGASDIVKLVFGERCDPGDVEGTIERLAVFLAAGMRAPVAAAIGKQP